MRSFITNGKGGEKRKEVKRHRDRGTEGQTEEGDGKSPVCPRRTAGKMEGKERTEREREQRESGRDQKESVSGQTSFFKRVLCT